MACDECLGLIAIAIVCLFIGVQLLIKYAKEKNVFTLYMSLFFILGGISWLLRFLFTDWVFDIYDDYVIFLMVIGVIPQFILILFVLAFFKVSKTMIILLTAVEIVVIIIDLLFPDLRIFIFNAVAIIIVNVILFILNYRRNDDIKSLGFAIGLLFILFGESMSSFSLFINGIFLILAAIVWGVTYSGLLEKHANKS